MTQSERLQIAQGVVSVYREAMSGDWHVYAGWPIHRDVIEVMVGVSTSQRSDGASFDVTDAEVSTLTADGLARLVADRIEEKFVEVLREVRKNLTVAGAA